MVEVTRETLANGAVLAFMREVARRTRHPELRPLSDAELAASLRATLAAWDGRSDVWVFAYGSLIWNPAIRYMEERVSTLHGWHRSFCLWAPFGRGTPEYPGLMLGLDHGGSCRGSAFRIAASAAPNELELVWAREMAGGLYRARFEHVATDGGPVQAIAFVVDPAHGRYAGRLDEAAAVERIATAAGQFGTCADYLLNTAAGLASLGLHDEYIEHLAARVRTFKGLPPAPPASDPRRHPSHPKF